MKRKKILIISIAIITFLISTLGVFIIIYSTTDVFKTDEQLFYKYFSNSTKSLLEFDNSKELDYITKVRNLSNTAEGKISVTTNTPQEDDKLLKAVNDFNITFSTKNDNLNKKYEGTVKLNYNENVYLPLEYKILDNMFEVKSDLIFNQYFAVKYNELEQLNVPEVDIKKYENILKQENIKKLIEDAENILVTSIDKKNFSKTQDGGYELILNNSDIDNIILKISNCINTYSFIPADTKKNLATELTQYSKSNAFPDIHIVVYENGNIVIKTNDFEDIIKINGTTIDSTLNYKENSIIINIMKQIDQNQSGYFINCTVKTKDGYTKYKINTKFTDIDLQNSKETYELGINFKMNNTPEIAYNYIINVSRKYSDNINIETTEENGILLNDLDNNTLNNLLEVLILKFEEVNQLQMNQLGLSVNPIIYATPYGFLMTTMMSATDELSDEMQSKMSNTETEMINSMISKYEGKLKTNNDVKSLYETVKVMEVQNNINIEMQINGAKANASVISNLDANKRYTITLYKGNDGVYNRIIIE